MPELARKLKYRGVVRNSLALLAALMTWSVGPAARQDVRPTFRASVDRVTVNATVRTRRGRPVTDLKASDFELLDDGKPRPILEFRTDPTPVSLALLVDFSGSMDVAARRQAAHDNVYHLLSWLTPNVDQAGLYVFDKQLQELQPIAPAPGNILAQLDAVKRPFGATSLFDAIAQTGRLLAGRGGPRRAVAPHPDGADTASRLTARQVSGIASSIDVPVYIVIVISPFDRSGHSTIDDERLIDQAFQGPLGNLARWTGGEIYAGTGPAQSSRTARQIVSELRQQYLIAFEPGARPGWHPIELRTRDKDLVVRARSGYIVSGQPDGV
jgi:Ca-activated chloride channel family protein